MRVVIIGGGIMGCASALALADRGVDVVVVERATFGAEASIAAAGILGAQIESHAGPEQLRFLVDARERTARWVDDLRARTGLGVGHWVCGALVVARDGEAACTLARDVRVQGELGLRAELAEGSEARRIEPALSPTVEAAAHFPDESQIDPPALLRALVAAMNASRPAIAMRDHTTVASLVVERDRCAGVRLDDGETIAADATLLAAGSWSSLVGGVPESLPRVVPIRGQIVQLEERASHRRSIRTMLFGATGYVVPRGDGRVLCGSTLERVGYRREVDAAGVVAILSRAFDVAPSLASASFAATWVGFRPCVGDDAPPLVGRAPLEGLYLATGHHRSGILLAKATADAIADAVLGTERAAERSNGARASAD